jgi:hypothetical protein
VKWKKYKITMKKLMLAILSIAGLAAVVHGGSCGITITGGNGIPYQECPYGKGTHCSGGSCAE